MKIKIEWPFGPKLTCERCKKKFKYRGLRDDEGLDGAPVYCDDCEKNIELEEANELLKEQLRAEGKLDAPEVTEADPDILEICQLSEGKTKNTERDGEKISIPEKAVEWAKEIANNNIHGYSNSVRWGNSYDCSSAVYMAYYKAGLKLPIGGSQTTWSMHDDFIRVGFVDVKDKVNRKTGEGLIPGDVLLNVNNHCCMYVGNGKVFNARSGEGTCDTADNSGNEIRIQNYWDFEPWDYVLRYPKEGATGIFMPLDADGDFGRKTKAALIKFQKEFGIAETGTTGPVTWDKIFEQIQNEVLREGSKGWLVTALQCLLNYFEEE